MRTIFYTIGRNIVRCFRLYYLPFHILAIGLTYGLVISGFDWFYFAALRNSAAYPFLFPAVIVGALLPLIVPLMMFVTGKIHKNLRLINAAAGVGQAALLGLLISSTYKFFTGRIHPPHLLNAVTSDVSEGFRLGILRGGVFEGWPSSHTTVAFAMAVTLIMLYPKYKIIKFFALAEAFYVGFGVSISIHWFSDFIAGAIIGSVIGVVVGRSFLVRLRGVLSERVI